MRSWVCRNNKSFATHPFPIYGIVGSLSFRMADRARRKRGSRLANAPQSRPASRKERVAITVVCLLLALIVAIAFGQSVRFEFVNYDDDLYVYENPMVANGLSFRSIEWAFTHAHAQNWHPLTTISHLLDCQLYGLQAWGHHLNNLLLHACAAILLFLALLRLTNSFWPSALVAVLFAIHPLRAGSVSWVSERKDMLSGVFFALTLWAYARYVRSPRSSARGYLLVLAFFALGLMCKPTLVTIPFVLILTDYWPLRRCAGLPVESNIPGSVQTRSNGYLFVEKIPFLLIAAGSCVITIIAQSGAVIEMSRLSFGDRVANALVSYLAYLGQLIWPVNLTAVYPYPQGGWSIGHVLLALIVLLIVSLLCFVGRRKYPFLLVGWLWFLGMLIPMIGLVQVGVQARADRYTYLSQIGLYLILVWGAVELLGKWPRSRNGVVVITFLIVIALIIDASVQTSFWRSSETLWNHALACTSNNHVALTGLGDTLMRKEGRLDEAIFYLGKAVEISPLYAEANNDLGYSFAKKGDWENANAYFQTALRIRPDFPQAHSNLAASFFNLGRKDEAMLELREAVRLDDNYPDAHRNLAVLLLQLGRRDEAIIHFRKALSLKPDDSVIRDQLRRLGADG